jgi:hypothetical protein
LQKIDKNNWGEIYVKGTSPIYVGKDGIVIGAFPRKAIAITNCRFTSA